MNSCGECTVCCTVPEIKQLRKKSHTDCKNLTEKGCSIYKKRPATCKNFECGYISNNWSKELRPDLCGVMLLKFPTGIEAWQLEDEISVVIYDQIKFMRNVYGVNIKEVDARKVTAA